MPNAAPVFENALVMFALHSALKEKQRYHGVTQQATPAFLSTITKMEQVGELRELMEKMPKKDKLELSEVFSASTTPTSTATSVFGPKTPGARKNQIHQQHLIR